jgi:protein-disulfide isomerase
MSSHTCPRCSDQFDSNGGVRDHAWDTHHACHYCGEQLGDDADKSDLFTHWLLAHPDDLAKVDRKQADSVVDDISFSDRLSDGGVGAAVSGLPRRYFLVAGGAAVTAGLAGFGAVLNSQSGGTSDEPANTVDDYEYARIGSADAAATITYFGSYKCPICAQFGAGLFQDLRRDYVDPGDLAILYRNVSYFNGRPFLGSDAPNAGHAGLAVYNNEPESYLDFHEYIFENQPPESQRWATADQLATFASEAGVSNTDVVRTAVEENRYRNALQATASAASDAGLRGTPSLLVDGTLFNPLGDPAQTRQLIEDAIANA